MGAFFTLGALHYILITKPFLNTDSLGLYVGGLCVLGVLAYLYTLAPTRARAYEIAGITSNDRATIIDLMPKGRAVRHVAGQFAFVSFDKSPEPHPFTISKAPSDDGSLRFSIANLGVYTGGLSNPLTTGDTAKIQAPFGRFSRRRATDLEIWVAAGIGITPFVAWAQSLT